MKTENARLDKENFRPKRNVLGLQRKRNRAIPAAPPNLSAKPPPNLQQRGDVGNMRSFRSGM